MTNVKNIFDYASKELSMDSMVSWILGNYDCDNLVISEFSLRLFAKFSGLKTLPGDITNVEVLSQYGKVDVLVLYKYKNRNHILVIEDKTDSFLHDQLEKYETAIEQRIKNAKEGTGFFQAIPHYIFFKLNRNVYYGEEQKKELDELNKNKDWARIYLDDFYKLTTVTSESHNDVFDSYIDYIKCLYDMYYIFSPSFYSKWDNRAYEIYMNEVVIKEFKSNGWEAWSEYYKGIGAYTWLSSKIDYKKDDKKFVLEMNLQIRLSKDFDYFPLLIRFSDFAEDKEKTISKEDWGVVVEIKNRLASSAFFELMGNRRKRTIARLKGNINLKQINEPEELKKALIKYQKEFMKVIK